MDIQAQAMRALDLLESSEVMQEFDDSLWIKVDRDLWEAFIGENPVSLPEIEFMRELRRQAEGKAKIYGEYDV